MDNSKLDVTLTKAYVDALDRLVEEGLYLDRGEIILEALRGLLRDYRIEPFCNEGNAKDEKGQG